MKYYFKPDDIIDKDSNLNEVRKGTLYEIASEGLKLIKPITLSSSTPVKIRGAVICQKVAEGMAITEIVRENLWSPSEVEFFTWLKKHKEILSWYQDALKIRDQVTIDRVYSKVKDLDFGTGENMDKVSGVLKELKDIIKKQDSENYKESVQVYSPVIKEWDFEKV